MGVGDAGQLGGGDAGGKALHAVVAGVYAHQEPGARVDGRFVILGMGAVGGADFMQLHAGAGHDVRDAEGAADFDQFAAGNDALPAGAEAVQGQQHGGGVVVHHGDRLGAGQLADQPFDEVVAVAALAGGQVEFQVERVARREGDCLDCLIRQQGAAEVGMQHRAGQVEHAAYSAAVLAGQAFAGTPGEHRFGQLQRGQLAVTGGFAKLVQ